MHTPCPCPASAGHTAVLNTGLFPERAFSATVKPRSALRYPGTPHP